MPAAIAAVFVSKTVKTMNADRSPAKMLKSG